MRNISRKIEAQQASKINIAVEAEVIPFPISIGRWGDIFHVAVYHWQSMEKSWLSMQYFLCKRFLLQET